MLGAVDTRLHTREVLESGGEREARVERLDTRSHVEFLAQQIKEGQEIPGTVGLLDTGSLECTSEHTVGPG